MKINYWIAVAGIILFGLLLLYVGFTFISLSIGSPFFLSIFIIGLSFIVGGLFLFYMAIKTKYNFSGKKFNRTDRRNWVIDNIIFVAVIIAVIFLYPILHPIILRYNLSLLLYPIIFLIIVVGIFFVFRTEKEKS